MKKIIFLFALFSLSVTMASSQVETSYDKFSDKTTVSTGSLRVNEADPHGVFRMQAGFRYTGRESPTMKNFGESIGVMLSLMVTKNQLSDPFLSKDREFVFLLDDAARLRKTAKLFGNTPTDDGFYLMNYAFMVTPEELKQITVAGRVEFQWDGMGEFVMRAGMRDSFRDLYNSIGK